MSHCNLDNTNTSHFYNTKKKMFVTKIETAFVTFIGIRFIYLSIKNNALPKLDVNSVPNILYNFAFF